MKIAILALLAAALAPAQTWPSASPESQGMDSGVLAQLDRDIAGGKYGNVDSILILRHDKIVMDRSYSHDYRIIYGEQARVSGPLNAHDFTGPFNYFNAWWHPYYRGGDLHTLQSVTKTVASAVIGAVSIALTTSREFPAPGRYGIDIDGASAPASIAWRAVSGSGTVPAPTKMSPD